MNRYQGRHNMKWGGEMRAYYGEAARFEPINLVFNSTLTANSSDTPDVVNTGNQWATFMLGALDNQTSARLVPLQTPEPAAATPPTSRTTANVTDRLTLNLGLRWEFEPGPTDPDNRLSQRLDLTPADPRDAVDAAVDAGAGPAAHGEQGLRLLLQRRVDLRHRRQTAARGTARRGTSCRASA